MLETNVTRGTDVAVRFALERPDGERYEAVRVNVPRENGLELSQDSARSGDSYVVELLSVAAGSYDVRIEARTKTGERV